MPEGWKAKAKELGALARGREIKNALDLLRLVFLYLTEGKSFSGTAALLHLASVCSMTPITTAEKAAIFHGMGEAEFDSLAELNNATVAVTAGAMTLTC
jgi:hypothetical protein